MDRPAIVVTLAVAARQAEPDLAERKNAALPGRDRAVTAASRSRSTRRPPRATRRRGARGDGRAADVAVASTSIRRATADQPGSVDDRAGPRRAGGRGMGGRRGAGRAGRSGSAAASRQSTSSPAGGCSRTSPGTAARLGPRAGEDPSAAARGRHAARPDPVAGQTSAGPPRSTAITTRPSGPPTWHPASSPMPGPRARPATWSRVSRPATVGSCSASSAIPSGQESTPPEFERLFGLRRRLPGTDRGSRALTAWSPASVTSGRRRSPAGGTGASAARPAGGRSGPAGPPRGSARRRGSRPGWRCRGRSPSRGSR